MVALASFFILALATGALSQNPLEIHVSYMPSHPIPSTLYGYMLEDINHSIDGGLYAEMLQNRAFQAVSPGTAESLAGWKAYGGVTISVVNNTPGVSKALPNSLQVRAPPGVTGKVGFENTGYWGINVRSSWEYTGSFYAKSDQFSGTIDVCLVSSSGATFAVAKISGITSSWQKFTFKLKPRASGRDLDNTLRVTFNGETIAGKEIHFGLFSLFPPTYRNRTNGVRIDLAEALQATKPGMLRFPGGNNLEGHSFDTRWKWRDTIGPLENRPGRRGDWTYPNTDGMGLMEYLNFAEDLGMEPILAVWAGLSLADSGPFPVVPEKDIQQYVQEVIDEIQFITGDPKQNKWAKLRADYGHPEPYALQYIEIGNEDFFEANSYAKYRWKAFVTGLEAAFPNKHLRYIATTLPSTALKPIYGLFNIDLHHYNVPEWFIRNAFQFEDPETGPRNSTEWLIGEFAVTSTNKSCILGAVSCGRLEFPILEGAVAEAAYTIGLERNSDIVFASAYAPTLQHIRSTQWTPNLITFDAGTVTKSVSYYVREMFSKNIGSDVLRTNPKPSPNIPLHWVASRLLTEKKSVIYIKAANTAKSPFPVTFSVEDPLLAGSSIVTILTNSDAAASNKPSNPNNVVPKTTTLPITTGDKKFSFTFPAQSVAVLELYLNQ